LERPLSTLDSVALLIPVARASSDSETRRAMRRRRRFAARTSCGRSDELFWGDDRLEDGAACVLSVGPAA